MPEGWEMDPQIGFSICDHFSWALGYFPRQTKLKWTKNFKALFLGLTKATVRGFDVSMVIWRILHQEMDMKCVFRQLISGRWVWPYSPLLSGECPSTMRIFWPSTQRSKHSPWSSPPPPPTRPLPQICLRKSEIWSQKCSSKIRRKGLLWRKSR